MWWSNDITGPVIEASYRRFLTCFDVLLREAPFVGDRPGAAILRCLVSSPS